MSFLWKKQKKLYNIYRQGCKIVKKEHIFKTLKVFYPSPHKRQMKQQRLYCSDYWKELDHLGQNLSRGRIQRKTWCMGPYAGVDYNLTLCTLQGRLQHIYHGQPYARIDLNPMLESTLSTSLYTCIVYEKNAHNFASLVILVNLRKLRKNILK